MIYVVSAISASRESPCMPTRLTAELNALPAFKRPTKDGNGIAVDARSGSGVTSGTCQHARADASVIKCCETNFSCTPPG
jgi:hypothetical protein